MLINKKMLLETRFKNSFLVLWFLFKKKENSCFFQLESESEETVLHMGDEWYFLCSLCAFLCPFLLIKNILSPNFTSNFTSFIVFFKCLPFKKPSSVTIPLIYLQKKKIKNLAYSFIHPISQGVRLPSSLHGHLEFKVFIGDF